MDGKWESSGGDGLWFLVCESGTGIEREIFEMLDIAFA